MGEAKTRTLNGEAQVRTPPNIVMPARIEEDGLTIVVKPSQPLRLELDLDQLTFGDVMLLQSLDNGGTDEDIPKAMGVLTRVIGMDANKLPIRHLRKVIEAVMQVIQQSAEQKK